MKIKMLTHQFIQVKNSEPVSVDDLLDFAQRSYVLGELTLPDYHDILKALSDRGAKKPVYFYETT